MITGAILVVLYCDPQGLCVDRPFMEFHDHRECAEYLERHQVPHGECRPRTWSLHVRWDGGRPAFGGREWVPNQGITRKTCEHLARQVTGPIERVWCEEGR